MKTMIFDIIERTEHAGSKVRFISSDMGADNQSLWIMLKVTEDQPYFKNPVDGNRSIYVFSDVHHGFTFKNITQAFARNDKILIPEDLKLKYNLPTREALIILHLKELFSMEEESIFKLTRPEA